MRYSATLRDERGAEVIQVIFGILMAVGLGLGLIALQGLIIDMMGQAGQGIRDTIERLQPGDSTDPDPGSGGDSGNTDPTPGGGSGGGSGTDPAPGGDSGDPDPGSGGDSGDPDPGSGGDPDSGGGSGEPGNPTQDNTTDPSTDEGWGALQ